MKNLVTLVVIFTIAICFSPLHGNNILVSNVSLEGQDYIDQYVFLEFDISWDNSWRTSSIPLNYDAAWVFAKYRVSGGVWKHMVLRQTGYFAPTSSTIEISSDSVGALIYRDTDGNGTASWSNIRFRWDYGEEGVADDALLEVRVYGIEMVYIPTGAFYLGDGQLSSQFYEGNFPPSGTRPYQVLSESSIDIDMSGDLYAGDFINEGTLPASYPKGYDDFYCMKYELSQEQYVEFLNTLDRTQQNNRTNTDISGTSVTNVFVMSGTSSMQYCNGINCDGTLNAGGPITFFCNYNSDGNHNDAEDGQNVACNWLNWSDIAAYLDWSGFRPFTEFEFEKLCRGPNDAVQGEYAWGSTAIYGSSYGGTNLGQAGSFVSGPLAEYENTGHCSYDWTDPAGGVLRCGIFAASAINNTRVETGSGYYGVMELSGNGCELVVNAYDEAGWSYTGLHGNGSLNPSGDADVNYWPGINGNESSGQPNGIYGGTTGTNGSAGAGYRGGSFLHSYYNCSVSDRSHIVYSSSTREYFNSGRGCRTAL